MNNIILLSCVFMLGNLAFLGLGLYHGSQIRVIKITKMQCETVEVEDSKYTDEHIEYMKNLKDRYDYDEEAIVPGEEDYAKA